METSFQFLLTNRKKVAANKGGLADQRRERNGPCLALQYPHPINNPVGKGSEERMDKHQLSRTRSKPNAIPKIWVT